MYKWLNEWSNQNINDKKMIQPLYKWLNEWSMTNDQWPMYKRIIKWSNQCINE